MTSKTVQHRGFSNGKRKSVPWEETLVNNYNFHFKTETTPLRHPH